MGHLLRRFRHIARRAAAARPHMAAHGMDRDMDGDDDQPLDFFMPEDVEQWPAFMLRTLIVPIPGHVEGSNRNEVINLSKLVLLRIVPQGQPRQLDAVYAVQGAMQRSASAPVC